MNQDYYNQNAKEGAEKTERKREERQKCLCEIKRRSAGFSTLSVIAGAGIALLIVLIIVGLNRYGIKGRFNQQAEKENILKDVAGSYQDQNEENQRIINERIDCCCFLVKECPPLNKDLICNTEKKVEASKKKVVATRTIRKTQIVARATTVSVDSDTPTINVSQRTGDINIQNTNKNTNNNTNSNINSSTNNNTNSNTVTQ